MTPTRTRTPILELLGCLPDTIGFFNLGSALYLYAQGCGTGMQKEIRGMELHASPGIGFTCYFYCLWACLLRCLLNWATPVPGGGCLCCVAGPRDSSDPVQPVLSKQHIPSDKLPKDGDGAKENEAKEAELVEAAGTPNKAKEMPKKK